LQALLLPVALTLSLLCPLRYFLVRTQGFTKLLCERLDMVLVYELTDSIIGFLNMDVTPFCPSARLILSLGREKSFKIFDSLAMN
jgi:hypothetical protein